MKYLAHISKDGKEQTVKEHLLGTARYCKEFANVFGCGEQGMLAAEMHDIGKCSSEFQHRLMGGPKVDHSTAGAYELYKLKQIPAAFCVAGHHGGLPDGGTRADLETSTFFAKMNRAKGREIPAYSFQVPESDYPPPPQAMCCDPASAAFYIRMLYSCLVDADYRDTEDFMDGKRAASYETDLDLLNEKLNEYIRPWADPRDELNAKRFAILKQCIAGGETSEKGLFTLTVPTGGGKTVASLAFALRHAKRNGMRRVIYVVPYTSIIEQNAEVFRSILGSKNVLEHHSGVIFDIDENSSESDKALACATEDWDIPVVVTTAVQFFESLFSNRPSKCRKLHNIANSVVIFDEAQMIPVPYLRPCVYAISQLTKQYNVSTVLCTATQPALNPLFSENLPGIKITELCPNQLFEDDVFRRVTFRKAGTKTWEELTSGLNSVPQALCIVNSRKNAQKVFSGLQGDGAFHLSTLMYPAHRKATLQEIRRRLEAGEPCRVAATSLVEAGVDIDFPLVFREEAGLDSVLQAAGRCNREGKRNREESIVSVFRAEDQAPPIFAIPVSAGRKVMNSYENIAGKEAVDSYFTELLSLKGDVALDKNGIMKLLKEEFLPFQTVSERFHLIDSDTKTVFIPIGRGAELLRRLMAGESSRELYRALGQYGVSVYENHFSELIDAGVIRELDDDCAVLTDLSLYSENTGLSLKVDSGNALFV